MIESRVLFWDNCTNVRDLGGVRSPNGETRWERLVRADDLAKLTSEGQRALLGYGVRTIIDLRLPGELEIDPPPFRDHAEVAYHHISFVDPSVGFDDDGPEDMAEDYVQLLYRYAPRVAQVMSAIADAPEGVVLFHCHGGKDRTGLISALLLRLIDVPREVVAADYALSDSPATRAEILAWLEKEPTLREQREQEVERFLPRADVMLTVLDRLEDRYGNVESYLLKGGLTPHDIARLRTRLLE